MTNNETKDVITDALDIERIVSKYYKHLSA